MLNHTHLPGTEECFVFLFLAPYARTTRYEEAFFSLENQGKKVRFARAPHDYYWLYCIYMPSDNEFVACVDRKKSYGTPLVHIIQQNVKSSSCLLYTSPSPRDS